MDAIGLVASVVNIAQAVIGAIKFARTLYKAPDDLAALEVCEMNSGCLCLLVTYTIQITLPYDIHLVADSIIAIGSTRELPRSTSENRRAPS